MLGPSPCVRSLNLILAISLLLIIILLLVITNTISIQSGLNMILLKSKMAIINSKVSREINNGKDLFIKNTTVNTINIIIK
jgi:hypothetical protein